MAKISKISPYRDRQEALECKVQSLEEKLAEKDVKIAGLKELLVGKPNAETSTAIVGYENIEVAIETAAETRTRFEKRQKVVVKERRCKNTAAFKEIIKRLMKLK
ncbi:MAG: hypothetical protein HQ536_00365, partial [Parcubacteria group bacterium]|nr:hypothetical protein [Parcubacteria group bacterium]